MVVVLMRVGPWVAKVLVAVQKVAVLQKEVVVEAKEKLVAVVGNLRTHRG